MCEGQAIKTSVIVKFRCHAIAGVFRVGTVLGLDFFSDAQPWDAADK